MRRDRIQRPTSYFHPYSGQTPHDVASVTKSITATLVPSPPSNRVSGVPRSPSLHWFRRSLHAGGNGWRSGIPGWCNRDASIAETDADRPPDSLPDLHEGLCRRTPPERGTGWNGENPGCRTACSFRRTGNAPGSWFPCAACRMRGRDPACTSGMPHRENPSPERRHMNPCTSGSLGFDPAYNRCARACFVCGTPPVPSN